MVRLRSSQGNFFTFDEETRVFFDPKINRIISLENVQQLRENLNSSKDVNLKQVLDSLDHCLRKVETSSRYHDFKDPIKNIVILDRPIDNINPLKTPIYVCQLCLGYGGFVKDIDHFRFCPKLHTKAQKKNFKLNDQLFKEYLGYGFDGSLNETRKFLISRRWKDSTDEPEPDFIDSQLKWQSKNIVVISNVIKCNNSNNLITNISGSRILNPFTEEIEMYLIEKKTPNFDTILYILNQWDIWNKKPNYYKRLDSDSNIKFIDQNFSNAIPRKLSIYVCQSCKEFATRSYTDRMIHHIGTCSNNVTESAINVYSEYYELDTLDQEGKNPRCHFLINKNTFSKVLKLEDFILNKFDGNKEESVEVFSSNYGATEKADDVTKEEELNQVKERLNQFNQNRTLTDEVPVETTTRPSFNPISQDQIDPTNHALLDEIDDGELADIETPANEEEEEESEKKSEIPEDPKTNNDFEFEYGKEDEYNTIYQDGNNNTIKKEETHTNDQTLNRKESSIKLIRVESDGELSYPSSEIEEIDSITFSQLRSPIKNLKKFNLNSTPPSSKDSKIENLPRLSSSSSIELLHISPKGSKSENFFEKTSDFDPGLTSPLAKGTDIDVSDKDVNEVNKHDNVPALKLEQDDEHVDSDEITRDYEKYVLGKGDDDAEEDKLENKSDHANKEDTQSKFTLFVDEESSSDEDFFTPKNDPYEKEYPESNDPIISSQNLQSSPPISPIKFKNKLDIDSTPRVLPRIIPTSQNFDGSPTKKQKVQTTNQSNGDTIKLPFFKLIPTQNRVMSDEEFSD
ncbi:hypothetical protein BN7_3208 [Wickerhamomyces ciferrii]|uniref:Uncharacterized protein n=1 Tax=Wickerhamomyces ciferrii (strain ATCC 14091 / BCRC 22168 / CBS 111 / JCM 3599 / NBRC 0793 / NRRL Y-1031 F-60-10) TaxID=1206466 RepID=K0KEU6_WICCF|nr:uncharacterized protein BN7_3208 [Wickerhamomyces ciferrii]CCH43655.1 hypothetical protein BN7_3208 [Wickerhamomyces ciferrii]